MFFAHNENGERVYIENAQKTSAYFCPTCGKTVRARKGPIRAHHFAHIASECADRWSYGLSEWHRSWQERFPEECREVVIEHNGEKHRADVLFEGIVFEFQNSKISEEEFAARNTFYVSAGYKVAWVFNFSEEHRSGGFWKIDKGDVIKFEKQGNLYLFEDFFARSNEGILIWFDFTNNYTPSLISSFTDSSFTIKDARFSDINEMKNLFEESLKHFGKRNTTKGDFKKQFGEKENYPNIINLCDKIDIYYADMYFKQKIENCPIKENAVVRDCMKTFKEPNCKYVVFGEGRPFDFGCIARFVSILDSWKPEKDRLISIERDERGMIESITVVEDGEEKQIDFSAKKISKALLGLAKWN